MKKTLVISLFLTTMLLSVGCKSKESAYRRAYEQAKQREIAAQNNTYNSYDNANDLSKKDDKIASIDAKSVSVRKEKISTLPEENQDYLKQFSVVIGSFQNPTNAKDLKDRMVEKGYNAVLAKNEMGMLRVIISSFDSKEAAIASREAIKAAFAPQFGDAWLLERAN